MADGTRTSKVVGGVTHTYYYSGGKLLRETYGSTVLDFFYDAKGTPIAMKQNGAVYYYITNLQGDVVRLVNSAGSTAAYYKYDPYGNATTASVSHATINPLRYRGYYYDTETGLYYCQSRYYDPTIGRFINADTLASTKKAGIGSNIFTYCFNNPLNYVDTVGTDAVWIQEKNSAAGQGHTGLMVQDDKGNWFYFFWGPSSEDESEPNILALCVGVPNGAYYVGYTGDSSQLNLRSTDAVVAVVQIMSEEYDLDDRSGRITNTVYLEGDFSKTHAYLNGLFDENGISTEKYNLILNNCVQKSLHALSASDNRFSPYHVSQTSDGVTMCFPAVHPNYEYRTISYRLVE